MKLSDHAYDVLKFLCTVFLPALGTLIFAISKIWGFPPYAENIVGTLSAIAVFIGSLIGISSIQYHKEYPEGDSDGEDEEANG